MPNECIELIGYLKRYGLSNDIFKKLHPAGISLNEYHLQCLANEYFTQDSDDEITKLRLVFLRVTIRTDKCSLPMREAEFESLTEAAIRGFPSAHDKQHTGADAGGFCLCNTSIH